MLVVKIKDFPYIPNNRVIVKIKLYIPLQIIHSDEKDKIRVQNDLTKIVTNVYDIIHLHLKIIIDLYNKTRTSYP